MNNLPDNLILGLESSCDETAAAVVSRGRVLSSVIRSQIDLHGPYGGVVPEVASRAHLEAISLVTEEALCQAGLKKNQLDGLAVTQGPGLVGALLVALNFAKGAALALDKPLVGVNHVKAHALAAFMAPKDETPPEPLYPLAALVVSGGHTNLYRIDGPLEFTLWGRTRDDAAGEAFDKTAKLLGLGYPGGRAIEELARSGDPEAFKFSRPMLGQGFDFSFSGLKTQVLNIFQKVFAGRPPEGPALPDLAASFQAAVCDVLAGKLSAFAEAICARSVVLSGGVAANQAVRKAVAQALGSRPLFLPPPAWCADNGAMIAHLGAYQLNAGERLPLAAEALARWPLN